MTNLVLNEENLINDSNILKIKNLLSNKNNKNILLLNYATWCGHCNVFKPEWDLLKQDKKLKNTLFIEIESVALNKINSIDKKLYNRLIPSNKSVYFPMVVMYFKDKDTNKTLKTIYDGINSKQAIEDFVSKKLIKHGGKIKKNNNNNLFNKSSLITINKELDKILKNL